MTESPIYRVTYTEQMVRDAVRTFVYRRMFVGQKLLWFVVLALLGELIYLLWSGDRTWLDGVLGATVTLPLLMVAMVWRAHYRTTVGKFRKMATAFADVSFVDR